jgi:hypothetical protein
MAMKLISDFQEYYDIYFDGQGKEFSCLTTQGPNKIEQFKLLEELCLKTPKYGLVKNLINESYFLVIYEDIHAHCGQGKILVDCVFDDEFNREKYSGYFCSEYIGHSKVPPSKSLRLLNIGCRQFLIEYKSFSDWRSNCGEGSTICLGETKKYYYLQDKISRLLWAIDFVENANYELVAIDYNESPGVKGIEGFSEYISNLEIYNEIRKYY